MATLLPFPFGSEIFVLLPTSLVFFGRGCCKLNRSFLKVLGFPTSWRHPSPQSLGRKISDSFPRLVKPWGLRIPMWVGLGAVGAGPARAPRETVEGTIEKPAGKGFTVFTKASCERLRELRCFSLASPFLILEASVGFCQLLEPGKAAASAPGADPKGLVAATGSFGLLVLGEGLGRCCSRLLWRMRGGLREGRSACAVTWTSRARAGSSAGAATPCAKRTE